MGEKIVGDERYFASLVGVAPPISDMIYFRGYMAFSSLR